MEWTIPCVEDEEFMTDDQKTVSATSSEYIDIPMPDVRSDWKTAKAEDKLGGCGLHKNFTYEELCDLEESLFQRRLLADVPTPDVIEYHEQLKKKTQFKAKKRRFQASAKDEAPEVEFNKEELAKEIKEKLKAEVLKELLAEIKGS